MHTSLAEAKKSPTFCFVPWVTMLFLPDGKTLPCCSADYAQPIGDAGTESIAALWNSPRMRQLRRNMLAGKKSSLCNGCYMEDRLGTLSFRTICMDRFDHHWPVVESTQNDGSVTKVNLAYLDVRASNTCNLRCRTCGSELSSSWWNDFKKMGFTAPPRKKLPSKTETINSSMTWKHISTRLSRCSLPVESHLCRRNTTLCWNG